MRTKTRLVCVLVAGSAALVPLGFTGCGGGGSSSGGGSLPQQSLPPAATLVGWSPADSELHQYRSYTFTATGTDPNIGGGVKEFVWDFGDGTPTVTTTSQVVNGKAQATCTHSFTAAGSVSVSVVARNNAGLSSPAATKALTVMADASPLQASFTTPAAPVALNVALGSTVDLAFVVHVANSGSGTVSAAGVKLEAGDTGAQVQAPRDLGNGNWGITVAYPAATALGTREITPAVQVVDSNGVSSERVSGPKVTVRTVSAQNGAPVVGLESTPAIVAGVNATYQGVSIAFKATASDPDGDPLTYAWTFGDGGKGDVAATQDAAQLAQTHVYDKPGVYPVVFTANDGRTGGVKTITLNLNILANTAPSLSVAMDPAGSTPFANVPIQFSATTEDTDKDVDGKPRDVVTVSWDFGDGTPVVTGPAQMHSFPASGPTVVKVTADDGKGGVATRTLNLDVQVNRPPVAKVETAAANRYQNKAYTFTASATDPDGNPIQRYEWDFGDGTGVQTSATNTIQHTYASTFTGKASAKVRGVDSHGSVGDFSPAVDFTVVQTQLPVVSFVNPAATTLHVELAGTVDQDITVRATNPNGAAGIYLPVDSIAFSAGDSAATVVNGGGKGVANGDGTYTFQVRYAAASAAGTRSASPTAQATDLEGIQGLQVTGPAMTVETLGANTKPEITVTTPASPTTSTYARKAMALAFTLKDTDNDPVTYTVDWGDGTTSSATPMGDFSAGVSVPLTHTFANAMAGTRTVTVTATDKRSLNANAVPQSFTVTVTTNAAPTATITSPQASGEKPTGWTGTMDATTVVIPAGGKLKFVGTSTLPSSGDPVTSSWTFEGGVPSSATGDSPEEVIFTGTPGEIKPVTVTYTVKDVLDIPGTASKTFRVLVDGVNTQNFLLGYQYRLKSEDNGTVELRPVVKAEHGLGTSVEIYQDGLKNTYTVQDLSGTQARVDIPVRSDLPFYVKVPSFGGDDTAYLMRIPNAPTGKYADSGLVGTDAKISRFQFRNASSPYNPQLDLVTAQGFADETASARERKLNGDTNLSAVLGTDTSAKDLWVDRLSVPWPTPGPNYLWGASGAKVGDTTFRISGIPAYQTFAEWPVVMKMEDGSVPQEAYRFKLDFSAYSGAATSEFLRHLGMQAYRVPANDTDPYQLSPKWQDAAAQVALNPKALDAPAKSFFQGIVHNAPGATPLAGGLNGMVLPYDPNDKNRTPLDVNDTRSFVTGSTATFGYAEYLWSSVWARPLVLNVARLNAGDSLDIANYGGFRYSDPAAWPKASGISPNNSAFDLTANGSGTFNAVPPVGVATTGVGRFFWTAYTPSYTGDANLGAAISRTWLSDHATKQPPTSFPNGAASGDATSAFGFLPPQDAMVDKRARTPEGAVDTETTALTGYRVTWFNPTRDAGSAVVAPDFWVVALTENGKETHFLLPPSYPATQRTTDGVLTDARTYLPSGNAAKQAGDTVAPGYCWFDIPRELRPTTNTGVSLRVYAVKSILNNNNLANASATQQRPLNRPDWMDAIKTATAAMVFKPADGTDLSKVHRIPFNYAWDIVVVNGPNTPVAE